MQVAGLHLLSRCCPHNGVLHSAKSLPHLHPSLVKAFDPIFHFVNQRFGSDPVWVESGWVGLGRVGACGSGWVGLQTGGAGEM